MLAGLVGTGVVGCDWADTLPRPSPPSAPPEPTTSSTPPAWHAALGSLDDLAPDLRLAFTDARGFVPLPPPQPGDWRSIRPEPPQTVADFLAGDPIPRAAERDRLVLCPLGTFPFDVLEGPELVGIVRSPPLSDLAALVTTVFATPTDVHPSEPLPADLPFREVRGHHQFAARAILGHAAAAVGPDTYGLVALVNVDLYAWTEQQYAFGYAEDRLAVVGFSRFDPSFFGGPLPDDLAGAILRRAARVLLHEVGHLFGLAHCEWFRCTMNGVADLDELDRTPLHLCPVCQRKLHLVADIDPLAQHRALLPVLVRLGLDEEVRWLRRRIRVLGSST